MEIAKTGGQAGLASQRELWDLVKARRQSLAQSREAREFVAEQLGSLLLGQDLGPAQQAAYIRRLGGTAALAHEIREGPEVSGLEKARVARKHLAHKVGGVSWRAFPVTRRAVSVTPLHRRVQNRMALALRAKIDGAPESARTVVHAVKISVDTGYGVREWHGQDRVELSGWGIETLALQKSLAAAPSLPPPPAFLFSTVSPRLFEASSEKDRLDTTAR